MSAPRILITGGAVYGPLDDNKLVGNRVRGIWAIKFAAHLLNTLASTREYKVTLLLPDTLSSADIEEHLPLPGQRPDLTIVRHKGYWEYAKQCEELAHTHDVAIMAAAVVNWIPAEPVKGKMPTKGYNEGDIINVPFVLAPRVINRMRIWNPDLTLIGCKMLIGSQPDELVEAAYDVVLKAKCNAVVANDMGNGLRLKRVVHQDRTVIDFNDDFTGFFAHLQGIIDDQHFTTLRPEISGSTTIKGDPRFKNSIAFFNSIIDQYRDRFTHRQVGNDRVFGSLLVPTMAEGYLISPREKGEMFSSEDAAWVPAKQDFSSERIYVAPGPKATLNAPLLVRMWEHWKHHPQVVAVLHLHEQLPNVPTAVYAPPGTVRDNLRDLDNLPPAFNINGHGFIACLDAYGKIVYR